MANNSINLVDLDFFSLKNDLKNYLKSNKSFKDYDFDGSNLNVLLDVLSYNTHKNAFYLNMLMSEAFLDSSQLKSSILSHAKELNYIPPSRTSSKATVTVTFNTSESGRTYNVPKGSLFSTILKTQSFTFSTSEAFSVTSVSNTYTFTTDIYEGYYVQDSYVFLDTEQVQRFKITNKNVDISSISVNVFEDSSVTPLSFKRTDTLLGLKSTSNVFFIQPVGNGYYEILFGDGILGRKPKTNSVIIIDYRISSGDISDGAINFSMDFDPTNEGSMGTYTVETVSSASGGSESQNSDLIKFYAPRYFATQQRAVSTDDYSSLILSQFSSLIDDVVVYGGETLEPKLYGRVVIALKPVSGDAVPTYVKDQVSNYLLDYVSLPTRVLVADPNVFHCQVNTTVQYDPLLTTKTGNVLRDIVFNSILSYSSTNLERFDRDFRYSRFVRAIDESDDSITSNDTDVKMIKKLSPLSNRYYTTEINFGNAFHPARGAAALFDPVISSSQFTYIDENNVYYPFSYIQDDGFGNLIVRTSINNVPVTINQFLGTVDHERGILKISKLLVSSYGTHLSIYARTRIKDIVINKSSIVKIDAEDITVNVIGILE